MPAKLPHDTLRQFPIHLTYRLLGSIPQNIIDQLVFRRDRRLSDLESEMIKANQAGISGSYKTKKFQIHAAFELAIEEALHQLEMTGPKTLSNRQVARVILESWKNMQRRGLVYVYAICVMSNHVHVVLRAPDNQEEVDLGNIVGNHKKYTSRMVNRLLDKTGQGLWERSYFDRRVREGKFNTVMWYVLNNPVKVGLVNDWRDWPGTYLNPDFHELFG